MKTKLLFLLITLLFYYNSFSQSSFYDYKELREFYIKTFNKYQDLLIKDLNSLKGISDNEVTKYYDQNQHSFKCRRVSFDIRLSNGKPFKPDSKIDNRFSKFIFNDNNLNIIGYKGNNLEKVRFNTTIPYENLNIEKYEKSILMK